MANIDKIKDIIVDKLGIDEEKVTRDASFKDDLGADSLDIAELVMELEDEFDIVIPTVEIIPANFNSAEDIWAMIVRLQEEG